MAGERKRARATSAMSVAPQVPPPPPLQPWRAVVFGDLHVRAATLERSLEVLKRVGDIAAARAAHVVCCGDFWDQRGILHVRQVDLVQSELERQAGMGVRWWMVPGNHDQVSQSGTVHGLRVFEHCPNVTVATEPLVYAGGRVAYLPWREVGQAEAFAAVPAGYVVFGHGEVRGARANNGHKAEGRFEPAHVRHLRAVYLSHYHARQQIGNVWYVGSPYEQDFGERGSPHGVAIVDSSAPERPEFVDFDDLPKHWRFTWPADSAMLATARLQDIVEVLAPKAEMESPAFKRALAGVSARDVRPLPLSVEPQGGAPVFALTVQQAVDKYVEEAKHPRGNELRARGHAALAAIADKGVVAPLGSVVRVRSVQIENFCAVQYAELDLHARGTMLLRGKMGNGKTALAADAMTWCLYGQTAPRKPGTSGASLRADDVVRDDADMTWVGIAITLDDDPVPYAVMRTKRRGQGSKLTVTRGGAPFAEPGISDTQDLVLRLVGLPYDLWRTCVSLGQGEVANFITDAQKKRTELLERAFQLGACGPAQEYARKQRKAAEQKLEPMRVALADARSRIAQLREVDYVRESEGWETSRRYVVAQQQQAWSTASQELTECEQHLQVEPGWRERKQHLSKSISDALERFSAIDVAPKAGRLHAFIGAAEAEAATTQRDLDRLSRAFTDLQAGKVCRECGQAIPREQLEDHLQEVEAKIVGQRAAVQTAAVRVANLKAELGQLAAGASPEAATARQAISDLRVADEEAAKALDALRAIRSRRDRAEATASAAKAAVEAKQAEQNPWEHKRQEQAAQLARLEDAERNAVAASALLETEVAEWAFWETGFGPTGLPVLVLRTALYELEMYANSFLSKILGGTVMTELVMDGTDLDVRFKEFKGGRWRERDYLQLSGGQRRCVQLAFSPFALGEMIFNRTGVRVPLLVIDELTTHLDQETKPLVCSVLRELKRETVVVIDHDLSVQGEFDIVYDVSEGGKVERAS